jgi:ATP-binding cassette subfamily F protein 3
MIELKDISKAFGGQLLFDQGSFTIGRGEKIGLVGRNGHGKTTLFKIINGSLAVDAGSIIIPKNYKIGYLEQNIAFSQKTLLEETCLGLAKHEREQSWRAEKILHGLGFSSKDMQRPPEEFSGGFQIRINLAKVLLSEAGLLLLDEPNNYLDIVAIRWLESFLKQWKGELVLITHDRAFMDSVVRHIVGIYRKKLRKIKGSTGDFYAQIEKEEHIYEKTRQRDERKRKQTEEFISKFRAKARQAGLAQSRLKSIAKQEKKEKLEKIKTFDISFSYAGFEASTMMNINNLSFSFNNKKEDDLFRGLCFRIGRRERLCVIGKNGKGKSTLLRLLAGELKPCSGKIKSHPRLEIGFYAQTNTGQLKAESSVLDEIKTADPKTSTALARNICGNLLFSQELALKPVSVLSGGEKSRVLLGKVMARPAHMLLLDEPTNHLDLESCEALCEAIERFEGSVVMVTHNELFLKRIAERLIVFDQDKVAFFDGDYEDFLDRVGWKDENDLRGKIEKAVSGPLDRKTKKRILAGLRQKRSAVLKPLENQIKSVEKNISEMEKLLNKLNQDLLDASYSLDHEAIAKLSKQIKELPLLIDSEYEKLDELVCEYDKLEHEFIVKISALEEK